MRPAGCLVSTLLSRVKPISLLLFAVLVAVLPTLSAQTVRIPDSKFRERLIALGYDANDDGRIQEAEIAGVRTLDLRGLGLINLEGIRAFKNLEDLDASRNPDLTVVDVSQLSELRELNLNFNPKLAELRVNGAVKLAGIYATNANLRSLDLTGITTLVNLMLDGNQLTALDVSGQPALNDLRVTRNRLTRLDLAGLAKLADLWAEGNQIEAINLDGAVSLQFLQLTDNRVSALDLTALPQLETVALSGNPLVSIRVRGLSKLKALFLSSPESQLKQLDLCGTVALESLQW